MKRHAPPLSLEQLEELLRRDTGAATVDFDRVWEGIAARIDASDTLPPGVEEAIRHPRKLDDHRWKQIEHSLLQRIEEHEQYEEPIDECIAAPPREQPRHHEWQQIERGLFDAIASLDALTPWERELKREIIPGEETFTRVETALMQRIAAHRSPSKPQTVLLPFAPRVALRIAASLVLTLLGVGALWYAVTGVEPALATYALLTHGSDTPVDLALPLTSFSTDPGTGVELGNRHGHVYLRDGAHLTVTGGSATKARYRLDFKHDGGEGETRPSASFFVDRHSPSLRVHITTADYDIEVTGTYFTVSPGKERGMVTDVFEGSIAVRLRNGASIPVAAGESFLYDPASATWAVHPLGETPPRDALPPRPDPGVLDRYQQLSVTGSVNAATVSVNGLLRGQTPLRMLALPGEYRISVRKEGYTPFDTTITLTSGEPLWVTARMSSASLPHYATHRPAVAPPAATRRHTATPPDPGTAPPTVTGEYRSNNGGEALFARARAAADWREGAALYRRIADSTAFPPLLRETALFSMAQLFDENAQSATAREHFLRYRALYPNGTFARETLMRLAELELRNNQAQRAIDWYLRYFDEYPTHYRVPELSYRVGLLYFQLGAFNESAAMIQRALDTMGHHDPQQRATMTERLLEARRKGADAQTAVSAP